MRGKINIKGVIYLPKSANWDNLPMLPFNETGERRIFHGEKTMLARHVLNPGFPQFVHSHPHEQIVYIESGHCEFIVGDERVKMGPGDVLLVPANTVHDCIVLGDEPVVNFDIFAPPREDFVEMFRQAGLME